MYSLKYLLITYIFIVNIIGFVAMGIDKNRAIKNRWRISEKTLFTIAIIGGSIGSFLGMQAYRHKTKHKSFTLGIPTIFIVQLTLFLYIGLKISFF